MALFGNDEFLTHDPDITSSVISNHADNEISILMQIDTDSFDLNRCAKSITLQHLKDAEIKLIFRGFDELVHDKIHQHATINGEVCLLIKKPAFDDEIITIAAPSIAIHPISSKRKREVVWPDAAEIKEFVVNKWRNTFAESLADFHDQVSLGSNNSFYDLQSENEQRENRKDNKKSKDEPKKSKLMFFVKFVLWCLLVVVLGLALVVITKPPTQPNAPVLSAPVVHTAPPTQATSTDDDLLAEFGLEGDVDLNQ